jgi:Second Messenger Oligonucleotide or Dinucleotide Synthetase domain
MSMTVVKALDSLLHSLELTEQERTDVARRAQSLADQLRTQKHVSHFTRHFIGGAFARDTAIRPLHDVSLFVVLDGPTHAEAPTVSPGACLEKLELALSLSAPEAPPPRRSGRAVNMRPQDAEIGFDVIPAFDAGSGAYWIPDRAQQGWLSYEPDPEREAAWNAHEKAGAKLRPLTRAAKLWNRSVGLPLSPFHLEVLTRRSVPTPPLNFPDAIKKLFTRSVELITKPCPPLVGHGPDLDAHLTEEQRSRAQIALRDGLRQVDQALQSERTFRIDDAHRIFRALFGEAYPETGRR